MRVAPLLAVVPLLIAACASTTASQPDAPRVDASVSAITTAASAPASAANAVGERPFTSAVYGYRADVPQDWQAQPALTEWDGGDVDHTAGYADRFTTPEGVEVFVLAAPTAGPLDSAADAHLTWLSESRGCPAPSWKRAISLDGVPATRVAIHCPDGVFGPTLVSKAIAVHDGSVVILTAFSPDEGADDLLEFDRLLATLRWAS